MTEDWYIPPVANAADNTRINSQKNSRTNKIILGTIVLVVLLKFVGSIDIFIILLASVLGISLIILNKFFTITEEVTQND